jgi:SPX domain protein involved in polyphosphate accumulation
VLGLRVVDIIERPLKLYYDNESTVLYAHNNKKTKAAKHINIRFYVVKEKFRIRLLVLSISVLRI